MGSGRRPATRSTANFRATSQQRGSRQGLQIWQHYNQALANFAAQHPERCILLHNATLTQKPEQLIEVLEQQWGWRLREPREVARQHLQSLVRPDRMQASAPQDPLAALHRRCSPESTQLLHRLDALAACPSELHLSGDLITLAASKTATTELAVVITSYNEDDLLREPYECASPWAALRAGAADRGRRLRPTPHP